MRDSDANDSSKGPAEHEALLRTRRGDGPPDKKVLGDLTGDSNGLTTRCWAWPRLQLDIPDTFFLEGTLFPFYDFPLPRPPVATTKQRAVSDPHKKLCVHFVGMFNERWVENTTPEFDPILRCGACDKRMRCK